MRAQLKRLHSPDAQDLRALVPEGPVHFSLFVQAMVGPAGEDSEESFDFTVCTASWLAGQVERDGPQLGLHHVVVSHYDYDALFEVVRSFCSSCEGETWAEIGPKVARLGRWEFDDYRRYVGP